MGRGKIKREIKREKRDFHLGGMQEEGESKILPPLRRHRVCARANKEEATQERKRKESSQEGAA